MNEAERVRQNAEVEANRPSPEEEAANDATVVDDSVVEEGEKVIVDEDIQEIDIENSDDDQVGANARLCRAEEQQMRSFLFVFAVVLGASFLPPSAVALDLDWAVYEDPEHGCRLDYPRSVFSADHEEEGEPLRFSSEDESTYFRVMGVENTAEWSTSEIKQKYLRTDMPGDVTYERTKSEFLVVTKPYFTPRWPCRTISTPRASSTLPIRDRARKSLT
jgi:hypothetical protein